jgi:hypothetical protein
MASARKAARVSTAATHVFTVTHVTTAYGAALFVVVIPMMIFPKTAKNRHIRPIIVKITRRVIIRSIVTGPHDTDTSGQSHQKCRAHQESEPPDKKRVLFHHGGVDGVAGADGLFADDGGGLFIVFGDGGGHVGPLAGAWALSLVLSQPVATRTVKASSAQNVFIPP